MIEIPISPNFSSNREKLQRDDLEPCICCGKPVKNVKHFLRVFWGSHAVTYQEANEIIQNQGSGGDMCYYPVGRSCLKKHPELLSYAKNAQEAIKIENDALDYGAHCQEK